jgi:DNA processing protein
MVIAPCPTLGRGACNQLRHIYVKVVDCDRAALAAAVRLALVPEFTPRRLRRFLDRGGTLEGAGGAAAGALRAALGLSAAEAETLARRLREADPEPELARAARAGIAISALGAAGYPAAFAPLPDPPPAVFRRGELLPCDGVAVAVVGARDASPYGLRVARSLAGDLARAGVTVVAGLARGIDAAAHEGALAAGGRTVAVLGSGLLEPYPPEHVGLLDRVAASGAVLSEFPLEARPEPAHFPRRNRLIAALSLAVVVIEAAASSGALGTARHALDLGREVLAVPGPVDDDRNEGTLRLLREGAPPVGSARDVFAALGWCAIGPRRLPEDEQRALEALGDGPRTVEEVARATGFREEAAAGLLVTLEVRGLAVRTADGRYLTR